MIIIKNMKSPDVFLKIILDSITEGVFTINKDQVITSFNQAAEIITGFPREEAIGKKCFEVFQADICQDACALARTLKTGKNVVDLPVNILDAVGRVIPISVTTAVLKDNQGRMMGGVETFRDLSTIEALRKEITQKYTLGDIISKSEALQKIFNNLPDIAQSDSTVLIQGPSGSGKELLAKAIHNLSPRKEKPFVAINCSALPETLLESELFGYVRGAFTDAKKDKPGKFGLADSGTLFLDEIGDLPLTVQAKLLRVLQEKIYEPLGSNVSKPVKARVTSATNKKLKELVKAGLFRDDLYYRLKVIQIDLPTLKERREDIPLLIDHFLNKFNLRTGKKITLVSPKVLQLLMHYDYPGNIRELENIIEHAFVLCHGSTIQLAHLPPELHQETEESGLLHSSTDTKLKKREKELILQTLEKCHGNRTLTAKALGLHPTTLWRKLKRIS
ncbi:MAG: sigma 54-interacting transcriptional regulator [Deltaproteobacteria bacterium]|nr:sigma 54-interacting transcriptional regulator [Deltaproteobacteria bacterium]